MTAINPTSTLNPQQTMDPISPGPDQSGVDFRGFMDNMIQANMEMLQAQSEVQQESRRFNIMSNVLKAKHDAQMNSIRNFK